MVRPARLSTSGSIVARWRPHAWHDECSMGMRRLVAALIVASACSGFPTPRVPQVEQAAQATHGGGERYRAHQRCLEVGKRVEDLVDCMRHEGYDFIAQGPTYPSPECWEARSSGTAAVSVPPHCFEHSPDAPH
jgi:hypothetical protein